MPESIAHSAAQKKIEKFGNVVGLIVAAFAMLAYYIGYQPVIAHGFWSQAVHALAAGAAILTVYGLARWTTESVLDREVDTYTWFRGIRYVVLFPGLAALVLVVIYFIFW